MVDFLVVWALDGFFRVWCVGGGGGVVFESDLDYPFKLGCEVLIADFHVRCDIVRILGSLNV